MHYVPTLGFAYAMLMSDPRPMTTRMATSDTRMIKITLMRKEGLIKMMKVGKIW